MAEIFRRYIGEYRKKYRLSYQQTKVVNDILNCRTPAMGGVWKRCDECQRWEVVYKPCKNRHCPKCGAFEKAQWLEVFLSIENAPIRA